MHDYYPPEYQRVRELGKGTFGRVDLAVHRATEREVAIKFLRTDDGDAYKRFCREGRLLETQVDNPFVVALLDSNVAAPIPHLVMEYCAGGSLRQWVTQRQSLKTSLFALSHAIQGLQAIHEVGGFHRDLKPENLLVWHPPDKSSFTVKVADFGLARMPEAEETPMTCSPGGTPGYMAPEIVGRGAFTPAADVYSLGIVALELVTGGTNVGALNYAQHPQPLVSVVSAMLQANPVWRPNIQQIAAVFKGLLTAPSTPPRDEGSRGGISAGEFFIGAIAVGALVALLAALAAGNKAKWDADVKKYPDSE